MAKTNTFHCSVITPGRPVLECEATALVFPAHDGEMGILRDRAPITCKLGIGALRVEATDKTHTFFIDRGFAQVVDNKVTILTEQAKRPEEIDADAARSALEAAHEMKITDDASFIARSDAIRRAEKQIAMARGA